MYADAPTPVDAVGVSKWYDVSTDVPAADVDTVLVATFVGVAVLSATAVDVNTGGGKSSASVLTVAPVEVSVSGSVTCATLRVAADDVTVRVILAALVSVLVADAVEFSSAYDEGSAALAPTLLDARPSVKPSTSPLAVAPAS